MTYGVVNKVLTDQGSLCSKVIINTSANNVEHDIQLFPQNLMKFERIFIAAINKLHLRFESNLLLAVFLYNISISNNKYNHRISLNNMQIDAAQLYNRRCKKSLKNGARFHKLLLNLMSTIIKGSKRLALITYS